MNCKPGDLAIVVRSIGGRNLGVVVTCVRLATSSEVAAARLRTWERPVWRVDRNIHIVYNTGDVEMHPFVADSRLRPIRDNNGEDEVLRIAGRPREVETQ